MYGKSEGSYTHIYLVDGRKITLAKKIKDVIISLINKDFCRIHNSHFVNIYQIEKMIKDNPCKVVMKDGSCFNVSRSKCKAFMERFIHL